MTIFYTGYRPVTKGRNSNDSIHTWKGTAGTYSNWQLFNTSHVLDGAPNTNVTPGAGNFPGDYAMSRWFTGGHQLWPAGDPGGGARIDGMRFRPLEFKGLTTSAVFESGFGHADRVTDYSVYSNYVFDGVGTEVFTDPGHAKRGVDATGTAATFGAFDPLIYKGITTESLNDPGHAYRRTSGGASGIYADQPLEWDGVPSAQALNV